MFGIGQTELLVILGVSILFFGAKRIPELGKGLGRGIRSFKEGLKADDTPGDRAGNSSNMPATTQPPPAAPATNPSAGDNTSQSKSA